VRFTKTVARKLRNTVTGISVSKEARWAGQLVRMSDATAVKKVVLGKPDGR
jgi:prophage antirepressor-like protein